MSSSKNFESLLNLCNKSGIFRVNKKTNTISYGPYGYMIINQIKNLWLKWNLIKTSNMYLFRKEQHHIDTDFDYYLKSVFNLFNQNIQPFGLIDTNTSEDHDHDDFEPLLVKNKFKTHLNVYYFMLKSDKYDDTLLYWQRKHKKWWFSLLSSPQNIDFKLHNNSNSNDDLKFQYKYDENKMFNLEKFQFYDDYKHVFKHLNGDLAILNDNYGKLLHIRTSCEVILENLLIDSIKEQKSLINRNEKRHVFHLDFRLAPYKACILVDKKQNEQQNIANDLLKMFFNENLQVFLQYYDNDKESLNHIYTRLDELGIPFTIYMPETMQKDGICLVRNRDTTIDEHLHFTKILTHFKFILNKLEEI